jgi:hypothetical protein
LIEELLENRERDFLLARVRVTMKSSLENIDVGDFKIESVREGESIDLPRWVAEELQLLGLGEVSEDPFETDVFKALSREKMLGPFQLSVLQPEFYLRMRRRLVRLQKSVESGTVRKEDYERLRSTCYDLIGIRLGKLLSLSSSMTTMETLSDKLTPEEKFFYSTAQNLSKTWKGSLLGEEL